MSKTPRDRSTDLRDSNNSFKSFNNVSINKTVSEDSSGIKNQKYPNQGQVEIKMLASLSYYYPITSSHCLLISLLAVFMLSQVPPSMAGLIIGKGGERIRKFSAVTECSIHISNSDRLYPGTTFRYITVEGECANVVNAIGMSYIRTII